METIHVDTPNNNQIRSFANPITLAQVYGLDGNDAYVVSFPGRATVYGGDGNDNLNFFDSTTHGTIYGGDGNDRADGGNLLDTLYGDDGDDTLTGWAQSDVIYGGSGADQLFGFWNTADHSDANDGDDTIYGGDGNDVIQGQVGNDLLFGDLGDDLLIGGPGADTMDGGPGNDTFRFDQIPVKGMPFDVVSNYSVANDSIQLVGAAFAGIGPPGSLAKSKFFKKAPKNADDRIGYKNGVLSYDENGSKNGGKVVIAKFDDKPSIDHSEMIIV